MKKTNDHSTPLDGPLKQLDQDMVWDEERKSKLRYRTLANLDRQDSKKRLTKGFKAASSLMLLMICLFAGYLFISENIGIDSDGRMAEPVNNTEDAPVGIENVESKQDESAEAIRAVIEQEFNGPDEKYIELLDAVVATDASDPDMSQEEYETTLERPEYQELMSYMEETYASYFTENGYDNFINTLAFTYTRYNQEYELNTSNIEIVQSEHGETLYDFTFQVEYTDENGDSSQFNFNGNAIAPEEGEIGKIEYLDEDGLLQEVTNNE